MGNLLGASEPGVDAAIAARAGGNPLAIEQALALLIETGTIAPGQGRWMPMADLTQVPVPDTSIGLIRQRLQTLPRIRWPCSGWPRSRASGSLPTR